MKYFCILKERNWHLSLDNINNFCIYNGKSARNFRSDDLVAFSSDVFALATLYAPMPENHQSTVNEFVASTWRHVLNVLHENLWYDGNSFYQNRFDHKKLQSPDISSRITWKKNNSSSSNCPLTIWMRQNIHLQWKEWLNQISSCKWISFPGSQNVSKKYQPNKTVKY